MSRERNEYSVQVIANAFDLLEALAQESRQVSSSSLASKLGISRNKVFRILATLEKKNLVERDANTGNYNLGLSAIGIAQQILHSVSIIRQAHPIMEDLAKKHDEAIYITVLNNEEVLFLDMVDSLQQIKTVPFVGKSCPLFKSAAGKVIKAMSSLDLREILKKHASSPNLQQLESELKDIRTRGIAVDNGGLGEGICSVAVAIKDYAGIVVGALTLLAPSFRMLQDRLENEIIPSMLEGAELLSMRFGYSKIST